jgi:iron complex outermembrane receptor protein
MRKVLILFFMATIGLGLALGDIPAVFAQEEFTLEEITVTAQKREEDLRKVPIAMDTISGYELTEMGMTNLEEALANLPSVIVQRMGGRLNVSIRGLDNDYSPDVTNSMVATTYDGSYTSAAGMDASGLYDTSRIEVLAGPQGTLYSRASTGGVVNIVSNNPIDDFETSGSVEFGSYDMLNTQGVLNVPLNDKLAFRTAFTSQVRDGYITNGTDDNDVKAGRLKIKYDPSENSSYIFGTEYIRMGGKGSTEFSAFAVGVDMFEDQPPGNEAWTQDIPTEYFSLNRKTLKMYMEMRWDLGFGELVFMPNIIRMKQNNYYGILNRAGEETFTHALAFQNEKSVELRLASHAESFMDWMVGLYHYDRKYRFLSYESDGSTNERFYKNPDYAIFGNATYPVSDTFRVTLGARYSLDKQNTHVIFNELPPMGFRVDYYLTESKFFNYKIGFEYDLAERSMLWADYSTGSRAGMRGWEDETVDSYQVGVKNRFLDERVQFNLTSYYYDYKNFELRGPMLEYTYIDDFGEEQTIWDRPYGKGAEANYFGIDLSSSFLLGERDRFDLSVSYMKAETSKATFKYDYNPDMDVAGGSLNNTPEVTAFASYQHEFVLGNGGSITPRFETRYQAETFIMMDSILNASMIRVPEGIDPSKVNIQKAHNISNISIKYSDASGKWSLNGYVKNIENTAVKKNINNNALKIGPPRTWGVVLSIQY